MYETLFEAPDRYTAHQMVEAIKKTHMINISWGFHHGTVMVRSEKKLSTDSTPLKLPRQGSQIKFAVPVHVRRTDRMTGKRVTTDNETANLAFLERQPTGLDITTVICDRALATINKYPRPFTINVGAIRGIATITDLIAFKRALMANVGNAKAFGLGFIDFQPMATET
jgi:hypothetical protein